MIENRPLTPFSTIFAETISNVTFDPSAAIFLEICRKTVHSNLGTSLHRGSTRTYWKAPLCNIHFEV